LRLESYFRERAERADVPAALALLDRLGTEAPRAGDELKPRSGRQESGFRLARRTPGKRRGGASRG